MWPATGTLLLGAALLALVAWLVVHDVARRLLRSTGLPRFSAACLLAGYAWLGLAGALWLLGGPVAEGSRYDAVVHAVFLGFVMSMIMAHAPVILPAVLRRPLPYHPGLAVAAWLLHGSLILRVVVGDLREIRGAWQLGGALNIAAVLLFVLTAATSSVTATRRAAAVSTMTPPGPVPAPRARRPEERPVTAHLTSPTANGPAPKPPGRSPRALWHLGVNAIVVAWLALFAVAAAPITSCRTPPGCSSTPCCSGRSPTPSSSGRGTSPRPCCGCRRPTGARPPHCGWPA
ncbi:hypothetical protein LUX09_23480 [Streptomyces albogriseolus]|nr:hypothetical protein [Streptomyces albogriseolus]